MQCQKRPIIYVASARRITIRRCAHGFAVYQNVACFRARNAGNCYCFSGTIESVRQVVPLLYALRRGFVHDVHACDAAQSRYDQLSVSDHS